MQAYPTFVVGFHTTLRKTLAGVLGEYPNPGGVLCGKGLLMPAPKIGIPAFEAGS